MTNSIDTLIRRVNERIPASVTPATRIEIHPCEWIELGDEISQLRGNLSLAEEGLANYALEVERKNSLIDAQDAAQTSLHAENVRLRVALQEIADSNECPELPQMARDALGNKQPADEPSEQRPADGTRDGDGVWQGGFWHPDPPDPLDEWLLMEFAPKDGTRILALVTEVQFYRDTETPNELIPVVIKWTGEYSGWSMPGQGGLRPTLWLPIKVMEGSSGRDHEKPVVARGETGGALRSHESALSNEPSKRTFE
jgi:hypothetical protein